MSHRFNPIHEFAVPVPITQKAQAIARQFASQQPTSPKAEQVRLNTLAVCVINDFLEMLGITTDLTASDSWNPVMHLCADVADLEVTGLGRLECRPLLLNQQICYIPLEVWLDRIGYVIVQLDELNREANVLGFVETVNQEEVEISQLRSPEDLINHLHQLMHPVTVTQAETSHPTLIHLSQWLHHVFDAGWDAIETVFNSGEPNIAFSFRTSDSLAAPRLEPLGTSIKRAKLIELAGHPVGLILQLIPESEQQTTIVLEVHSLGNQIYLPPLLQLIVIDESGETFMEAQSRNSDNYIQLEFSGQRGEGFGVTLAYRDVNFTENFVI